MRDHPTSGPSVMFDCNIYGDEQFAVMYNPLFPNMRVDATLELIQDAKAITTRDAVDVVYEELRREYKAKYGV